MAAIKHALKALNKRHLAEEGAHGPTFLALQRPFISQGSEWKEKAEKLELELHQCYKAQSRLSEQLVVEVAESRASKAALHEKESTLDNLQRELVELRDEYSLLKEDHEENIKALELVMAENQELRAQFKEMSDKAKKAETENKMLVDRWMLQKMDDAERLNEANALYEDMVDRLKANGDGGPSEAALFDAEGMGLGPRSSTNKSWKAAAKVPDPFSPESFMPGSSERCPRSYEASALYPEASVSHPEPSATIPEALFPEASEHHPEPFAPDPKALALHPEALTCYPDAFKAANPGASSQLGDFGCPDPSIRLGSFFLNFPEDEDLFGHCNLKLPDAYPMPETRFVQKKAAEPEEIASEPIQPDSFGYTFLGHSKLHPLIKPFGSFKCLLFIPEGPT